MYWISSDYAHTENSYDVPVFLILYLCAGTINEKLKHEISLLMSFFLFVNDVPIDWIDKNN